MKYNNNSTIKSVEDVKAFFNYLANDRKVNFHPDNSFDEYINVSTGKQTFSDEECQLFDRLMEECFDVCSKKGDEDLIYDLGTDILNKVA